MRNFKSSKDKQMERRDQTLADILAVMKKLLEKDQTVNVPPMPAPVVNVAPPAPPPRRQFEVVRDAQGRIVKIIEKEAENG